MKTYLEYKDDNSQKFWEITLEKTSFTTRYGKIGTNGQSKTKEFESAEKAKKEAEKLINQKKKKGYVGKGEATDALEGDFVKFSKVEPKIVKTIDLPEGIDIIEEALSRVSFEAWFVYTGNIELNEHLPDGNHLIFGNLKAERVFVDETTCLVVTGSLNVEHLFIADGSVFIGGKANITHTLVALQAGYGSVFLGDTDITLFMNYDGHIEGNIGFDYFYNNDNPEDEEFVQSAFQELGFTINEDAYYDIIIDGLSSKERVKLVNYYKNNWKKTGTRSEAERIPKPRERDLYIPVDDEPKDYIYGGYAITADDYIITKNSRLFHCSLSQGIDDKGVRLPAFDHYSYYEIFKNQNGFFFLHRNRKFEICLLDLKANKSIVLKPEINLNSFYYDPKPFFLDAKLGLLAFVEDLIFQYEDESWVSILGGNKGRKYHQAADLGESIFVLSMHKDDDKNSNTISKIFKRNDNWIKETVQINGIESLKYIVAMYYHENKFYFISGDVIYITDTETLLEKIEIPSFRRPKMAFFQDTIFLFMKNNTTLHSVFKLTDNQLETVFTDCLLEPNGIRRVQVVDNLMWVFSDHAVYTFDGTKWEMHQHKTDLKNQVDDNFRNSLKCIRYLMSKEYDLFQAFLPKITPPQLNEIVSEEERENANYRINGGYLYKMCMTYGLGSNELEAGMKLVRPFLKFFPVGYWNTVCYHSLRGEFDKAKSAMEEIMTYTNEGIIDESYAEAIKEQIVGDIDLLPMKEDPTFLKFKDFKIS